MIVYEYMTNLKNYYFRTYQDYSIEQNTKIVNMSEYQNISNDHFDEYDGNIRFLIKHDKLFNQ